MLGMCSTRPFKLKPIELIFHLAFDSRAKNIEVVANYSYTRAYHNPLVVLNGQFHLA
jgi:hypothetical protein